MHSIRPSLLILNGYLSLDSMPEDNILKSRPKPWSRVFLRGLDKKVCCVVIKHST